mgnify:CR=1 FL=1
MKCRFKKPEKTKRYNSITEELRENFKPRKKEGIKLAQSYKRLNNLRYYDRVKECGSLLDYNSSDKLVNANFCKNRLCPMCNWRRSMKLGFNISKVVEYLQKDYRFIFITLTIPSVTGDKLKETIIKMQKAFTNLFSKNHVNFKKSIKGYFKALEVTFNNKTTGYHPHFHVIAAVNPDYFKKSNKYYISRDYLLKAWQKEMGDNSIKMVRIEICRDKKTGSGTKNIRSAVVETAKYTVKSKDYIFKSYKLTDEVVSTLTDALAHRRLTSCAGVFRKAIKLLELDDAEDGDLLHVDDESTDDAPDETIYRYIWRNDNYILAYIFNPDGTATDVISGEVVP